MGFLKDKNGDPVTISIFDIFTNNKSSKDGAKGRKMSLLKDKVSYERIFLWGLIPLFQKQSSVGPSLTSI